MLKVYEYRCPDCRRTEERLVRSEEMDNQECSHCPSSKTYRLPPATRTNFAFADRRGYRP